MVAEELGLHADQSDSRREHRLIDHTGAGFLRVKKNLGDVEFGLVIHDQKGQGEPGTGVD
jgi:hypothetical protein